MAGTRKPNKGYWIICTNSYEVDGTSIPKGRMSFHTSIRAVINEDWRAATEDEIATKKWYRGYYFNLKSL